MRFALETLGVQTMDRELVSMSGRIGNMTEAMDDVFALLFRIERKQFDSQGGYGSGGWAALAPSTVARKRRLGLDPRILRETGALFKSVTGKASTNVALPKKDGLVFGTTIEYGRFHQLGTSRMPARPVVELPESDKREIIKIVQRHIVEGRDGF